MNLIGQTPTDATTPDSSSLPVARLVESPENHNRHPWWCNGRAEFSDSWRERGRWAIRLTDSPQHRDGLDLPNVCLLV